MQRAAVVIATPVLATAVSPVASPVDSASDDNVHATTSGAPTLSTASSGDHATDHTIRYDTWSGYNSTWKYFKMWADSTGDAFAIEEAKIDGRKISYPYLLDQKGEPRLESTNDFMVWFCERCDIVTKKSVVALPSRYWLVCAWMHALVHALQSLWCVCECATTPFGYGEHKKTGTTPRSTSSSRSHSHTQCHRQHPWGQRQHQSPVSRSNPFQCGCVLIS